MKMIAQFRRIRSILDGLLVLAILLAVLLYQHPKLVSAEQQSPIQDLSASSTQVLDQQIADTPTLTETEATSGSTVLANETIAAFIAAENSALTPLHYLTSLPILER